MPDYLKKIKETISEKSGVSKREIKIDSFFEEDLNLGELELIDIFTDLEDILHVDLLDKREELETVQDLVDLLIEKLD